MKCDVHVSFPLFVLDSGTRNNIGSEKMRAIVKKLCSRDPHQFFQRLETLARSFLDKKLFNTVVIKYISLCFIFVLYG